MLLPLNENNKLRLIKTALPLGLPYLEIPYVAYINKILAVLGE